MNKKMFMCKKCGKRFMKPNCKWKQDGQCERCRKQTTIQNLACNPNNTVV